MKKIFFSAIFAAMISSVLAVPAKPGVWKIIKLSDGTEVRAELRGDEYIKFWEAEDGKKYVKQADSQFFVEADMPMLLEKATVARAANPLPVRENMMSGTRVDIGGSHPDFVGSKKGLIILAEYTDVKFQEGHDAEYYSHIANDENFTHPDGFVGSIHDYFYAQSEGQFDLTFDVVGPVQLQHDMAYYGGHSNRGDQDKNAAAMIKEAAIGAATILNDFSPYDWFDDGCVDQIFVIYAGRGEADGGSDDSIWPHRSEIQRVKLAGKYVKTYACSNELQSRGGGSDEEIIDGIGAFCHEFSHCLGLPDLYDTSYSGNYGMGQWDLMHGGCYLGNSFCPCGYSGYEKNYCGWKEPIILTEDVEVENVRGISDGGDYYIIYNDANTNEYYVLENRSQTGWDAAMYGSGLLITHIDYDKNIWATNRVNTTSYGYPLNNHQRYTLFLADNNNREQTISDIAGDLYPYKTNKQLTNYSVPAAILYNKNPDGQYFMSKPITNIRKNGDGTVSFSFSNEVGKTEEEPMPEGFFFRETFNKSLGTGGNDDIWSGSGVAAATFIADNDGWTSSSKYGANKCARFGTNTQRGVVTTPELEIHDVRVFHFFAAPWTGEASKITLVVSSGDVTLSETEFQLESKKWTKCETKITGEGPAKIQLRSNKGRFFLDEVYLMTEEASAGIENVFADPASCSGIYTIDGRFVGTDISILPSGLYIINGKIVRTAGTGISL